MRTSLLVLSLGLLSVAPVTSGCHTTSVGHATARKAMTVEWIYNEGRAADDVPEFVWRADGKAILWDVRRPPEERTFELLDPKTGERRQLRRRQLVDAPRALASLGALKNLDPENDWRWPDSFDPAGEQALYLFEGDLFVLDLDVSSFERLTTTPGEEKSASFSPDGKQVAFVRDNDLYVVDLMSKQERRLTQDGSETLLNGTLSWVYWEEIHGRHDVAYWWSGDSRSIAYLQTDEAPVGIVHYVAFEDPYPELLTQRYPKAGTANPIVRLGVVALEDVRTTWVDLPEYEYLARVKWLPDSRRLGVQTMSRDQRRLDLLLADARTGSSEPLLTETDDAWINIHDDLYFLDDGQHFLWVSERSGFAHLYLYTMDGELVRQLTNGDWAIASSGGGVSWLRQAVSAIDEANGWIFFTGQRESSIERHLYRVRLDGSGLERVSGRGGTHVITFDPGAEYYFDTYSNIGTPPALELHGPQLGTGGKTVLEVAAPRVEQLAPFDLRVPELMTIPARDGFAMPAWILKPADFDPRKEYPLILYVYGGPSAPTVADDWDDGLYFDQVLLDAGFLVARCDNRSSTAISKRLENEVLGRSIGDVELNDYVDAARWLGDLPFVDSERLGIWGWSGGGSMTLLMMTRSQEFKAGIAVAAVTDWHYYDTKWAEFTMKRPEDNPDGYRDTSLALRAKDLHGRLLLVHGTNDDNVHPQNAWRFANELIEAGLPFDMMIYPMRKHGISDNPARIHLYEKMVEFWKLNL